MHRLYLPKLDVEVLGASQAFEETAFVLPRQGLAIDGGWGRAGVFAQPTLLISHLHMDHGLGLARYVVNRQKMGDGSCRIVVPAAALAAARAVVAAWQDAEGRNDPVTWIAAADGDLVPLERNLRLRIFAAPHNIPTIGAVVERRVTRVKSEYAHLDSGEIGRLVRAGAEPIETIWQPLFAYSSDTRIELLDAQPQLYDVPVLILECTFVAALHERPIEVGGHTSWEQICERAERFNNEALVLTHFSRRYAPDRLWRHLDRTAPAPLRLRLRPWIGIDGGFTR